LAKVAPSNGCSLFLGFRISNRVFGRRGFAKASACLLASLWDA
jgi:hypothetical protein